MESDQSGSRRPQGELQESWKAIESMHEHVIPISPSVRSIEKGKNPSKPSR